MCRFTKAEFFTQGYMAEVLYVGIPTEFDSTHMDDEEQYNSARSHDVEKHQELMLFQNLKSFFNEREINIED